MAKYALISPDNEILEYREYSEPPQKHDHSNKPRLVLVEEINEAKEGEIPFEEIKVLEDKVVNHILSRPKTEEELKIEQQQATPFNIREEIEKLWKAVEALRV